MRRIRNTHEPTPRAIDWQTVVNDGTGDVALTELIVSHKFVLDTAKRIC